MSVMPETEHRICTRCESGFDVQKSGKGNANRRLCYNCSPPTTTLRTSSVLAAQEASQPTLTPVLPQPGLSSVPTLPEAPKHVPGQAETTIQKELELLGFEDTADGVILLRIARALDDPELPGAQIASLSKILKTQLSELRATAPRDDDDMDKLQEEMQEKLRRRL